MPKWDKGAACCTSLVIHLLFPCVSHLLTYVHVSHLHFSIKFREKRQFQFKQNDRERSLTSLLHLVQSFFNTFSLRILMCSDIVDTLFQDDRQQSFTSFLYLAQSLFNAFSLQKPMWHHWHIISEWSSAEFRFPSSFCLFNPFKGLFSKAMTL